MASRQQLIIERLAHLTHGFARYVAAYDELVPFNSKQLATHRETIALRSQAGSVRAAVTDLRFVTSLRRTLLAWGLGVRGSVLVPDAEFAQALTAAVPALERLEDLRIDAPDLPGDLIDQLWTAIKSLGVVQNKAKIVAGTKALHHLLPELVIPMDHAWTGMFFKLHDPDWQQSQERTFRRVYPQLITVAQQVHPQQYVTGHGWRTSQTKILDNALIGFCKLDLADQPAAMTTAPPQVTFDVSGYPPAKDGALSIFGASHGHAPRAVHKGRASAARHRVDRDKVDEMLRAAVQAAYDGERVLFEERAHERSIVFHIARHLASQVEAFLPGWSVDVDYDRWHRPEMEEVKKQLYWRRIQRARGTTAQAEVPEDHDVYPDIIIHRRSRPSAEHDLLVVEVKKQEEKRGHEDDREKLRAFMSDPFRYQHAAFLILPEDGGLPQWEWIEPRPA